MIPARETIGGFPRRASVHRYEYSADGGETWEPSSTARLRSRAGVRAAEALMDGLVEQVTSRDGAVIYRRKPQEDA